MVSWFKRSNRNGDSEYEPLYPLPQPRRGQTQMLKYVTLGGVLCLGVAAVIVVLVLDSAPVATTEDVTNGNTDGTGAPLLLQATGNRLNTTRRMAFPDINAKAEETGTVDLIVPDVAEVPAVATTEDVTNGNTDEGGVEATPLLLQASANQNTTRQFPASGNQNTTRRFPASANQNTTRRFPAFNAEEEETGTIDVIVPDVAEVPAVATTEDVTNGNTDEGGLEDTPLLLQASANQNTTRRFPASANQNTTRQFPAFNAEDEEQGAIDWSKIMDLIRPKSAEDILVEIDQGTLRGKKFKSRAGRDFLAFLGVPYAKPPLGELRFKPPVEAEPWEGVLNATEFPLECIQKDKYNRDPTAVKGREDCLYFSIYVPKTLDELSGRRNSFPVMLYIHGGGQYGNGSRYHADYFMDEDVVLVMINYRLGIFGNLNTNDSAATGNQGMKDQVMGLEWIRDNIKNFGGDPKRVTLFGNSYGGQEVHMHILSPPSKGLFHGAICQSGVLLSPGIFNDNPAKTAFEFGPKVNCTTTNSTELVQCLQNVDAKELAFNGHLDGFTMSVDAPAEDGDDENRILPGHPLQLLQNGETNDVPTIFGVNSGEFLHTSIPILSDPNMTQLVNDHFNLVMPRLMDLDTTATDPIAIVDAAYEFYFGGKNISRETEANLTNLLSDRGAIHPAITSASFQSINNGRRQHVFLYYFNWEVPQKYSRAFEDVYQPDHFLGASHADELQMLFPYDDFPYISLDSVHANLSQTMVKLWVSFAADGEPSGTANEWLPITANEKPFQLFELNSNSLQMINPIGDRMAFWDQFNLTDLYVSKVSPS